LVKRLGLGKRVEFFSATRDVPLVLDQHDIVLMPSRWEGQGIVAMEAMAAGRVVIASKVGGLATIVRDGENGFVAEPNVLDFVRALRLVVSKPDICQRIGLEARAYAQHHFDIKREVEQYEALYQRVANQFKK
jgi:glycosyltransferase involved in cell wall biosynthesis